jgi:SAM-dependent methyltransferase
LDVASCEICGSKLGQVHIAREMMFGRKGSFRYLECAGCGSLRLLDVPSDLGAHYPPQYYSFAGTGAGAEAAVIRRVKAVRARVALRLPAPTVHRLVASGRLPGLFRWTAGLGLDIGSSIADVGCGSGENLRLFARNGFSNLDGFDPYLPQDSTDTEIRLHRAELGDIRDRFNLVMVHHAFEHMPDPMGTMSALAALLGPGAGLLIRTPVADSWAWQHYGVDWVQLDPPRHLWVHTTRSIELLAAACGLRVHASYRDGTSVQFWGSELYTRGLTLHEYETRLEDVFTKAELHDFDRRAAEHNVAGTGDSVCIVLRRE